MTSLKAQLQVTNNFQRCQKGQTLLEVVIGLPVIAIIVSGLSIWTMRILLTTWAEHSAHLALICSYSDESKNNCENQFKHSIKAFPFAKVVQFSIKENSQQKSIAVTIQHVLAQLNIQSQLKNPFR